MRILRTLPAVGVAALVWSGAIATAGQNEASEALYACEGTARSDAALVGAIVCDAVATPELTRRADVDNLQVREGALVVDLEAAGISQVAGLQPGDMIYRVGGTDVATAEEAAAVLSEIGSGSDTVVNFLRRGRPYRVKLRRTP